MPGDCRSDRQNAPAGSWNKIKPDRPEPLCGSSGSTELHGGGRGVFVDQTAVHTAASEGAAPRPEGPMDRTIVAVVGKADGVRPACGFH